MINKMYAKRVWSSCFLLVLVASVCNAVDEDPSEVPSFSCPPRCRCFITQDGFHKAICFSLQAIQKFSHSNKHPDISILDISYSNVSKINGELDKFTEVTSLDLSYNNIKHLNKILPKSKKLVNLNLSNNLFETFSASAVPNSVSTLDLQNNHLKNVPSDLFLLKDLEHLNLYLKGNPIDCSCENIQIVNKLLSNNVVIDHVKCASPENKIGKSVITLKQSEVCPVKNTKKAELFDESVEDLMLGDQLSDVENIGPETTGKKMMEMSAENNLDFGETFEGVSTNAENEDEKEFVGIGKSSSLSVTPETLLDGSGDYEMVHISEDMSTRTKEDYTEDNSTVESGSGDSIGSGLFGSRLGSIVSSTSDPLYSDDDEYEASGDFDITTTTEVYITGIFSRFFNTSKTDETNSSEIFPETNPVKPSIYLGGDVNWDSKNDDTTTTTTTEKPESVSPPVEKDKIIKNEDNPVKSSKIVEPVTDSDTVDNAKESKHPAKTSIGTYICIGIIIAILVGLIGITVIKGRIRKNREMNAMRRRKVDIEKGKEMVDMNKALLGKPVVLPDAKDKKMNGNYEMVPTHETYKKLPETGHTFDAKPKNNVDEKPNNTVDEKPTNDNKQEPIKNGNSTHAEPPVTNDHPSQPKISVTPTKSEADPPYIDQNGFSEPDSAPPVYKPVYSPDMGRIKIKLTETEKPKTPVLINRSRSNAGDIIITPVNEQLSPSKSTT